MRWEWSSAAHRLSRLGYGTGPCRWQWSEKCEVGDRVNLCARILAGPCARKYRARSSLFFRCLTSILINFSCSAAPRRPAASIPEWIYPAEKGDGWSKTVPTRALCAPWIAIAKATPVLKTIVFCPARASEFNELKAAGGPMSCWSDQPGAGRRSVCRFVWRWVRSFSESMRSVDRSTNPIGFRSPFLREAVPCGLTTPQRRTYAINSHCPLIFQHLKGTGFF